MSNIYFKLVKKLQDFKAGSIVHITEEEQEEAGFCLESCKLYNEDESDYWWADVTNTKDMKPVVEM